jgi:hypothetical protein
MTHPPDELPQEETQMDDTLRDAIQNLPRERAVPPVVFPILAQRLQREAAGAPMIAPRARLMRTLRRAGAAVAAIAAVVSVIAIARDRADQRQRIIDHREPVSVLLPDEQRNPLVQAALGEASQWRVAAADSLRAARWPTAARSSVERAFQATELALASARSALQRNPDDPIAREAINTLRERQLSMLRSAVALLDEL